MPIFLITGMSGVGKTSVIKALRTRGFDCIDMDEPGWSYSDADGNQRWNTERLRAAISQVANRPLFASGCSEDQAAFYAQVDAVILLSARWEIVVQRILERTETMRKRSHRDGSNPAGHERGGATVAHTLHS
jgi:dephospho-CoA kinase